MKQLVHLESLQIALKSWIYDHNTEIDLKELGTNYLNSFSSLKSLYFDLREIKVSREGVNSIFNEVGNLYNLTNLNLKLF